MGEKEDMDERLVAIKGYIRKAQLQTNLILPGFVLREEVNIVSVSESIEEYLSLAQVASKDVPPIERMVDEVHSVWKGHMPVRKIAEMEDYCHWLVGCTFAIISAIDWYLEAPAMVVPSREVH